MKTPRLITASGLKTALLTLLVVFIAGLGNVTANPVDPPEVADTMAPGHSIDVDKIVQTPEVPPRPDIVFLADTTGSMFAEIEAVQDEACAVMSEVASLTTDPYFAAAQYKDIAPDPFPYQIDQGLTDDKATVDAAIGTWTASGGGDRLEAQLHALEQLANTISWRPNSSRIIVWFGDEPGHDPRLGSTKASAIAALLANDVQVIAIGVRNLDESGQATDIAAATGGVFIPDATADEVVDAILAGLQALPITVVPTPVGCAPLNVTFNPATLTVTSGDDAEFVETIAVPSDPAVAGQLVDCDVEFRDDNGNLIVVEGEDAIQDLLIDIPLAIDLWPDQATNELSEDNEHEVIADVTSLDVDLEGKTVDFLVTGANVDTATPNFGSSVTDEDGETAFSYTVPVSCASLGTDTITGCTDRADLGPDECDRVTKDWVDTIPPVAQCVETENPAGKNKPNAPGNGGQGQNQDGFYEMLAEDNLVEGCAPLLLFITDNGSGVVFGPFPVGTTMKYTQTPGGVPDIQPMGSNNGNGNGNANHVDWHIWGTGDAVLTAVDQSGNVSDPVNCLVPPPPQ